MLSRGSSVQRLRLGASNPWSPGPYASREAEPGLSVQWSEAVFKKLAPLHTEKGTWRSETALKKRVPLHPTKAHGGLKHR